MKNNLFPATVNEITQLYWTSNGSLEIECTIIEVSDHRIIVKTNAEVPSETTKGIFWRPYFPIILPAIVIDARSGTFVAELGELNDTAKSMLSTLVAAQNKQIIPYPHRPGLLFRIVLKALFCLEQSLPEIRRRSFYPEEFPWSRDFETEWETICAEVKHIFKNVDVSDIPLGPDRLANWHSILIAEKGRATQEAKKLLPLTARLVESVPSMTNADLSILRPGAFIGYHKANSRTFLRMHLGLMIPKGDVCLQLEDNKLNWKEGKV